MNGTGIAMNCALTAIGSIVGIGAVIGLIDPGLM